MGKIGGHGQALPLKGPQRGGGQLLHLEHIDDVGSVDAHELRAVEEQWLIVLQRPHHLPHFAAGQVEIEVLVDDLHIADVGIGHPDEGSAGLQRQRLQGPLLLEGETVQQGKELLPVDGLEEVIQRPYAIALVGKAGGGGEEHDLRRIVEAADLPGGLQAVYPGHHHVQEVEGEPLLPGGLQQSQRVLERFAAQGGSVLCLPYAE